MADAPHVGMTVENAQELPTIFSNKFHITVDETHVRLLFGQMFLREEKPRTQASVVMSVSDAHELARLILKLIERNRAEIEKAGKPDAD